MDGRHARAALVALVLAAGCGGKIREDDPTGEIVAVDDDGSALPGAPGVPAPEASAADPFRPGDDWRGTYTCAQGLTDLDLRIVSMHGDSIDDAIFDFDWTAGGVEGSYHLTGTYDRTTGNATFVPGAWIDDPGAAGGYPYWYTVGMRGTADAHTYAGSITDDHFDACGSFRVTKP